MVRAAYILELVIHSEKTTDCNCLAECYQNGREQGFQIYGFPTGRSKAVLFSEARGSDSIVVYVGDYTMQSISKDAYSHQNFFDNCEEATKFIVETVIGFCSK